MTGIDYGRNGCGQGFSLSPLLVASCIKPLTEVTKDDRDIKRYHDQRGRTQRIIMQMIPCYICQIL